MNREWAVITVTIQKEFGNLDEIRSRCLHYHRVHDQTCHVLLLEVSKGSSQIETTGFPDIIISLFAYFS